MNKSNALKTVILVLVFFISLPLMAQRYFPLDVGNTWTYADELFGGEVENSVLDIDEAGIVSFSRNIPGNIIRLEEFQNVISIELEDEGLVLFHDFNEESWTHRDTNVCDDNRSVVVESRGETVSTAAGVFENCIKVIYTAGGLCADAGLITEWFAPDVGLVKWIESNFAGARTFTLKSFENSLGIVFQRGDVNVDGSTDIGDAVYTLQFLFSGGETPECLQSADMNDKEGIDITDPVYLLTYLFLGGNAPLPPFPDCGRDPSPVGELSCERYSPCEVQGITGG